jgi:hypothetical protein
MLKRIQWDVLWKEGPAFPHFHLTDSTLVKQIIESSFQSRYSSTNETPALDVIIGGPRPLFWVGNDLIDCDDCFDSSPNGSIDQYDEW